MAFEALAYFYDFKITDFPQEWLPLTYLYDPDLPLFPILYFHELDPELLEDQRPGERARVFGFVHSIALNRSEGTLQVTLALSKDLAQKVNVKFISVVEKAARSRLGLDDPVTAADISGALIGNLARANSVLNELWQRVVVSSFGGILPYGKCWDPVFGLARYIASWNSDGGRKGELIQLHAFASSFGERIQTGGGIHADFYLLPTWAEFRSLQNPLSIFSKYASFVGPQGATEVFAKLYTTIIPCNNFKYTKFVLQKINAKASTSYQNLNTEVLLTAINNVSANVRKALYDNYSAFNRGPGRSILSILMHHDLRHGNWDPENMTQADCLEQYVSLKSSYQSPKVMQLFAQQCFGSLPVLPIDNWVKTFVNAPISLNVKNKIFHSTIFSSSAIWGKVERLIWMAAQARKVHSSVAENILWCVRYGGPDKQMRGANPLGCKVCEAHIRAACPSYDSIKKLPIDFNSNSVPAIGFLIKTSANSNTILGQSFLSCESTSIHDEYTPRDRPSSFTTFPDARHTFVTQISVEDFISYY